MTDKICIGTCSCCGGRVMQYQVLWIVGEWPAATCENCGATEQKERGPVIPMRSPEIKKPNPYLDKDKFYQAGGENFHCEY